MNYFGNKKTIIISFIILIPKILFSETIINKSDSIYQDATVCVYGSGFGTKSFPSALKYETFEQKNNLVDTAVGTPVPQELPYWTGRGGFYSDGLSKDLTISDEQKRHSKSSRAAKAYLAVANGTPTHAQQIWHNGVGFSKTGQIYCNMWIYFNWVRSPVYKDKYTYYQVKYFNLSTSHLSNGDPVRPYITEFVGFNYDAPYYSVSTSNYHRNGRASHTDQSLYYEKNIVPNDFSGWINVVLMSDAGVNDNTATISNGWRTIQISSPNFSAKYNIVAETNKNYLDDETKGVHPIDSIKIGWFLGNNLLNGNMSLYYDDIYIDNTFSRVEIGNNAVYENCTHREIQPITSWTETSIKFLANILSFEKDERLYLYVFNGDNDGNVSQGHELKVRPYPTIIKATGVN
jgi:hypothetical protein